MKSKASQAPTKRKPMVVISDGEQSRPRAVDRRSHDVEDSDVSNSDDSDEPSDDEIDPAEIDESTLQLDDPLADTADDDVDAAVRPAVIESRGRSLAVRDPLQAYINETRRYPLLTAEEEHSLAVKYREHGDLKAARRLVTANLRLVVKIAHEYRRAYRQLLDLVQEGNIGLMHAVHKFDPYRGVKLSTYAAWWIRAYMLKFILNNWRLVKIGTTQSQRKLFFNLKREVDRLQRMGVYEPTPKLLAERLDVAEHEVESMQNRLAARDVSLDAPIRNDNDSTTRLDFVAADGANPDQLVEGQEFSALLQQKIAIFGAQLKGRDKEIFDLRTVAEEPLTLQEIGDRYNITRERARQLERRVMNRLRDYLRQELGDAVDVALGITEDTSEEGPRDG